MQVITRKELARTITGWIKQDPGRKNRIVQMLAGYIIEAKLTDQVDLLINDIALEWQKISGETQAVATSRYPFPRSIEREIILLIKKHTGSRHVRLHREQDESLIGGALVRAPELEIDMSIRRALNQLRTR